MSIDTTISRLFAEARTQNGWRPEPVADSDLRAAYDIARWGPTSLNSQPMRVVFLRGEAKQRTRPALLPGNVEKAMTAPVLAVIGYDTAFHTHLPEVFPHNPAAMTVFANNEALRQETAFRNGTLQGAYLMLALRAVGLDVGPMSGFNAGLIDSEFFEGTTWRVNFLCGIGRGDRSKVFPRSPRLQFDQIARFL